MKRQFAFAVVALAFAVAACRGAATSSPTHTPIAAAVAPVLPAGVTSCAVLGEVVDGHACRPFDTQKQVFADAPDGTPEDALARRVFLYERWLDLYNAPEHQAIVRNLNTAMAPGDPESKWSDDKYLHYYDDHGDSAGFGTEAQVGAAFRFAVTGTDADYQRMEEWVRGSVAQFDATGIDGYLARWHFAGVPPGTPIKNGFAMQVRAANDNDPFDIPASALDRMPAWYKTGISINGSVVPVRPSWEGHISLDAISGPMGSWPFLFDLIRDPALKARMALQYGCFLKRLRIFRIIHISQNAELQSEVAKYLTSGVLHLDPDDPDLTKIDEVWGFYLPQYNHASAATYPASCPATLSFDAAPSEVIDVSLPGFKGPLFLLLLRQAGGGAADAMDFAFYPGVRASDSVMLDSYALGAYHMTRDPAFLQWRSLILGTANGLAVTRTIGAFELPRSCRTYYRTGNVYTAWLARTLLDNDPSSRAFAQMIWSKKFKGREEVGLRSPHFEVMYSAALGIATPDLPQALSDLMAFGGAPGHLDDPRRNYPVDLTINTPPGITFATETADDQRICSTPITILGVTIPTNPPDPAILYTDAAPPAMLRPPDNWQWEKNPFTARRYPGDAGQQQYAGLDLNEPYWIARYFHQLPDTHLVLAR